MPLDLDDGYTLGFETLSTVADEVTGRVIASGLPVVSGQYRPATWEELQRFRYKIARAGSGDEEVSLIAGMIASHVVAWDVAERRGGPAAVVTAEYARRLPEPIASQLLRIVTTWAPRQDDDEKNSAGG